MIRLPHQPCRCDPPQPQTCRQCYLAATNRAINLAWGGDGNVSPIERTKKPCGCGGKCDDCPPAKPAFTPRGDDPACGVVIGSYRWPSLVALQIATIRHTCGPVPILVSSDDPGSAAAVSAICAQQPDVFHWPNHVKIGHTGGDIAAFFKGAIWGQARGLRVVAKLSQRFLVTQARWLQDGALDLLASGLFLASQRCRGSQRFDLRTEAVLLNVARWSHPHVLARILPRPYWQDSPQGINAETIIYRVLQDLGGEVFWPWPLIGEERRERRDGVLWHNSNSVDDYRRLAARFGIQLDHDFTIDGWQAERAKGIYSYG